MADNENKASDAPEVTKSNDTPAQPDQNEKVDLTGGVADGTVEKTNEDLAPEVRERISHEEKIVHDTDEAGNVVGWHKVPADGSTPKEQKGVADNSTQDSEENK